MGPLLGQWTPGRAGRPEGITVWGNDLWLVDPTGDRLYRFTGGAALRSGRVDATSNFRLSAQNLNSTDVVTDGTRFWVTDDTLATDRVFRYSLTGVLEGTWTLSPAGPTPTGITLDPNNVNHLWVVDSTTDRVYQYDAGTTLTTGSPTPSLSFPLATGNGNATGIADPRVFSQLATAEQVPNSNPPVVATAAPKPILRSVFTSNTSTDAGVVATNSGRAILRRLQTAIQQRSLSNRRHQPDSPLHRLPQPAPIAPRDLDELFSSPLGLLD
ncbi:MAG UNVERIFIED_CONTAM: hypothetical protein LVR18_44910 [Planctomycetaceae bacterium]|jgi:hypothetical protein